MRSDSRTPIAIAPREIVAVPKIGTFVRFRTDGTIRKNQNESLIQTVSNQRREMRPRMSMNHLNGKSGSANVLIVEDEVDTRESLAMLLKMSGHSVCAAATGASALELAETSDPDIVLIDIGLPGMDGFELARQLRQKFGERRPLLVATTGYGTPDDRQRSADAGLDLHMLKPCDTNALLSLLNHWAQIRQYLGAP